VFLCSFTISISVMINRVVAYQHSMSGFYVGLVSFLSSSNHQSSDTAFTISSVLVRMKNLHQNFQEQMNSVQYLYSKDLGFEVCIRQDLCLSVSTDQRTMCAYC
jgi:hypothetical protein